MGYNHPVTATRMVWGSFIYTPYHIVTKHDPGAPFSVTGTALNEFNLQAGIDQTFNPFNRKYWVFLLGAGAGARTAHYKTAVYHQQCITPDFCILGRGVESSVTDTHAFLYGKIGIAVREMRVAGQPAGLTITFVPEIARLPSKVEAPGPDGYRADLKDRNLRVLFEMDLEI